MLNNTQNYYIGYPPTKDIEDFESVIVGKLSDYMPLPNEQVVVKTPVGIKEIPNQLKGFKKYTRNDAIKEINKIEHGAN